MSAESLSQQITRLLGTDDWVLLHSGHLMLTDDDLEALELADDVRASEAGDTPWDREHGSTESAGGPHHA